MASGPAEGRAADRTAGPAPDEPLRHYLAVLRRRFWVLLTAVVIVGTLGLVQAFRTRPVYRASAKVLIETRMPQATSFEDVAQLDAADRNYYNTQAALLESRAVLEQALTEPGMQELFGPDAGGPGTRTSLLAELKQTIAALLGSEPQAPLAPWERLREALIVEQLRDTHLLVVSAESTEPESAAVIADAAARALEQYHVQRKRRANTDAFAFLSDQTREQQRGLDEAESALQQYREQAGVPSLSSTEGDNPVLARLARLSEEMTDVQVRRIALQAELKVVQGTLKSQGEELRQQWESLAALEEVRADPTVQTIRQALVQAEKDASALADVYGSEHPQKAAADAKVALLRTRLLDALRQIADSLPAQLQMLSRREEELKASYDDQNRLAVQLAGESVTYARLEAEVARRRKLFDVLVERMREVDLNADYARTNVEVVETAQVPGAPVRPRKLRMAVASACLGLILGLVLAFVTDYLDDSVRTPEDVENRIGIPFLGFVPSTNGLPARAREHAHDDVFAMIAPSSPVAEAYRSIRTSLFFSAPPDEARTVVVTSGGKGEGKTTTATGLALVIAQAGKRVLLIDADMRQPAVHRVLKLPGGTGLSTVLVGEATFAQSLQHVEHDGRTIENLDVLVAGPTPPNPADLLDSDSMRRLLAEARQQYDRVILDAPPVLLVADASLLGGMSDAVVLVMESARSRCSFVERARQRLEAVNARVIGGVLNKVRPCRLGSHYSDYYSYGYSQYYDYYRKHEDGGQESAPGRARHRS